MSRSIPPAPGFVKRIGDVVDRRRGVEFQQLASESLLNRLTGTSMPFGWTLNPFRGCEVGCRYCYARPTHEYLGHGDPEEFEERIYVKQIGASKLRASLVRARETGQEIAIGTATDPYQPAEGRFGVTRGVLEAMAQVPGLRVGITTKSTGILRDREVLARIARRSDLWVNISLISVEADLLRQIEPRAPRPDLRLDAMRALSTDGIRTRLFLMPVLPLLTDGEGGLRELLAAALAAGAREVISQALFLRTEMTWRFFLEFVQQEFPWALLRYRALYPRPGSAPPAYRDEIERRVSRLSAEVGFSSRTREERVRSEGPPRPRQLALEW
ncbi:MAG TPA: radical SAM protein [Candidatus Nitrosotalea sp.]|jgi:DNA repair photolyase|nr:radical SAM protein [Candidatus Nitrosotalea sp.]